jgi:hypothetical protein
MAQADSRLLPEDPSVEHIAAKLVERLRAKHKAGYATHQPPPRPTAPKRREPGVYFGLPAADYHADPSLGSTDIKRLLQAPPVFWFHSWMNPTRPPAPDSAARQRGRALHKLVLEGEETFGKAFAEAPTPERHPGCLVSLEDLKVKCRELCEPVSGTKAELAKRIKAKAPDAIILSCARLLRRKIVCAATGDDRQVLLFS